MTESRSGRPCRDASTATTTEPGVSLETLQCARARIRRQAHQHRLQQLDQRREMMLVVAPAMHAGRVQRLTDLFRARRAYRAIVAMELEASVFPGQAAEIEQAPHLALEVADELLIFDVEHEARPHLVPVV